MQDFARFAVSLIVVPFPLAFVNASTLSSAHTLSEASAKLATMQVPFVPNGGQWDKQAAFAAHTFAGTLFVTTEGILVYSLPGKLKVNGSSDRDEDKHTKTTRQINARTPGWVLTETFIGADHQPLTVKPEGYRSTQAKAGYIIGAAGHHTKPLDSFERVRLGEVFKGVEVELRATGNNVEKIFTVKPHQDTKQIHLRVAGANKLTLGKTGELIVQTGSGPVIYTAPIAYQEDANGKRSEVKVAYALNTATHSYGFTVGDYNPDQALVIDPLLQSTFLGSAGNEIASMLAIHPTSGEVYVAGGTTSSAFPGATGGARPAYSFGMDAFVSRFNASLTVLIQSTYLGGSGFDAASALAIHPASGDVYVAGETKSTDFPATAGGAQAVSAGSLPGTSGVSDAFVSRFNADLTTLVQSTYLGGAGELDDVATALAIHQTTGEVYVAGEAGLNFPATVGGAQSAYTGGGDAFVSRFNPSLTVLTQSTYLGGTGKDVANALAIHPANGEVYVAGKTDSLIFPTTVGGAQPVYALGDDAFVSRLNASLRTLAQSTYLGGVVNDSARALVIHPASGDVYVAGATASTAFPGTVGGVQPTHAGGSYPNDAFVSRFNASLTALTQSTYLGGKGGDAVNALAIHPTSGEVYVAGSTGSPTFPGTTGGAQATCASIVSCTKAFITRFNADLTTLAQSTYLGGSSIGGERAAVYTLAIHSASGEVYVAGTTDSNTFPATSGGAQAVSGGGTSLAGVDEAFITRISRSLALVDTPATTAPGAPVIGTATAGNAQATINFTAPANDGGSPITGYTATSSPGGITATGAASPITVSGLTNGTVYTFTVTASNAADRSAASSASNSVTPTAPADPPAPTPTNVGNGGDGGGGGGGNSVPMLVVLSVLYWWRRRKLTPHKTQLN